MGRNRLEILKKKIAHRMGEAVLEWNLIEEGDRILVGVSGGKDSYTLLHFLRYFRERAPVRFDLLAVHLDQGQPGFPVETIRGHLEREGFDHKIIRKDTYALVREKAREGDTACALCSRFRRGILYNQAVELGCTKIALGHHRDDAIETLLLNLFFEGRLMGMPAIFRSDDGRNTVIRPLIYVPEEEIREYAALAGFPAVPCSFCGGTERDRMGELLDELSRRIPEIRGNILAAMRNVAPGHLLHRGLRDLAGSHEERERSAARTGAPSLPGTERGSATRS